MPNDAKTKLDQATHRLQDQPPATQRQPPQAQQRDTTGTILTVPANGSDGDDDKTSGA